MPGLPCPMPSCQRQRTSGLRNLVPVIVLVSMATIGCQRWIDPLPGVRIEPTRAVRQEGDFGPDSAYQLLVGAGKLPSPDEATAGWERLLDRFQENPWPAQAPQAVADRQPWSPADYARIRAILDVAAPNLALARQAVAAPDPQVPTVTSIDARIPYVRGARDVTRLLMASAYTKEADPAQVFAELLTCIRFGNILSRGGSVLNHMIDMRTSGMAVEALWRIPTRTDVPAPVLRRTAQELLRIADGVEPYVEAMRGEAHTMLAAFSKAQWPKTRATMGGRLRQQNYGAWLALNCFSFLTGSTRAGMGRDFTHFYQHLVDLAAKPYHEDVACQARNLVGSASSHERGKGLWSKRNPEGLLLARQLTPIHSRYFVMAAERDAMLRGTALYLAILAYEKDTGAPPKALADLVPKYLPRVPLDPFDGKPFRYGVGENAPYASYLWGDVAWGIYSIGSDFSDSGGQASRAASVSTGRNQDIVWIPKPFPKVPPPMPEGGLLGGGL
ncbi:MAG: hypothetical protein HN849_20680 [Victivallales bacterium]|nr:hypothetical protein [Victivallales bacterium]